MQSIYKSKMAIKFLILLFLSFSTISVQANECPNNNCNSNGGKSSKIDPSKLKPADPIHAENMVQIENRGQIIRLDVELKMNEYTCHDFPDKENHFTDLKCWMFINEQVEWLNKAQENGELEFQGIYIDGEKVLVGSFLEPVVHSEFATITIQDTDSEDNDPYLGKTRKFFLEAWEEDKLTVKIKYVGIQF